MNPEENNLVHCSIRLPVLVVESMKELARIEGKPVSEVHRMELETAVLNKINAHYTRKVAKLKLAKIEKDEHLAAGEETHKTGRQKASSQG